MPQGLLGHESVATTEIYTRVSAARLGLAIQALEAGIRGSNNFYRLSA